MVKDVTKSLLTFTPLQTVLIKACWTVSNLFSIFFFHERILDHCYYFIFIQIVGISPSWSRKKWYASVWIVLKNNDTSLLYFCLKLTCNSCSLDQTSNSETTYAIFFNLSCQSDFIFTEKYYIPIKQIGLVRLVWLVLK